MLRPNFFRAASQNVERGAAIGSTSTIVELPPKVFPPIFPPDPTSEIGKIWKHYDYPRLADPVFPMLQWGNCWSRKSSNSGFWECFSVFRPPIITAGVFLRNPPGLKILVLRHFSSMRTLAREGSWVRLGAVFWGGFWTDHRKLPNFLFTECFLKKETNDNGINKKHKIQIGAITSFLLT